MAARESERPAPDAMHDADFKDRASLLGTISIGKWRLSEDLEKKITEVLGDGDKPAGKTGRGEAFGGAEHLKRLAETASGVHRGR